MVCAVAPDIPPMTRSAIGLEGGLFFLLAPFSSPPSPPEDDEDEEDDGEDSEEEIGEGSGAGGRGMNRARKLPHTRNDVPA